ncbi:unnamed protein product [Acanthoscelides obtectus]|uniref:MADF domain-containing protein n=1 Tax=Acanthoscelides obtectus TaxID=200917 RepID=A0A9P0PTE7_ACAOB|nr:unnamed protein product [Acanthoscelides obtectus]CAK1680711.1 hypothetical protein AOBTE_LOCUS32847 [Acanthoscelides obtectus]
MFPDANKKFVIKKISSLRSSFRRQIRRINSSKRSGVGTEDVPEPTLWYFDLLSFLMDQEESRAAVSSIGGNNLDDQSQASDSDSTDGSDNESLLEDRVVQSQAETQENIEDFEVVRLEDRQSVQAGNQVPHQEQLKDMPSTPKRNTSEGEQFLVPPKSSRKKKGKPTSTTENENITQEAFQMMKAAFHRSNGGTQETDAYTQHSDQDLDSSSVLSPEAPQSAIPSSRFV